jgi:ribonucleoside-triphosphate reductase
MIVIKRDGSKEKFSQTKVKRVIQSAFQSCGKKTPKQLVETILGEVMYCDGEYSYQDDTSIHEREEITVEEIQDIIEDYLVRQDMDVARSFIVYREKHKSLRDWVANKQQFINKYKGSSNTANATIDDNSNVASKNIGVMNTEIHKEDNIQISRAMVTNKLKELYPNFDSKQYERDLKSHIIYKHDESSFAGAVAPYCCSISMYPFLNEGIRGIGGLSAAPKNLDSYCGMFINLIFATSAQFAGAVATSEFLVYFDYFARKEWGDDY